MSLHACIVYKCVCIFECAYLCLYMRVLCTSVSVSVCVSFSALWQEDGVKLGVPQEQLAFKVSSF